MPDSKKIALEFGQEFAAGLLPSVQFAEQNLSDDEHKLIWWAAFFGYMGGVCAASLGAESVAAIQEMTLKTSAAARAKNEH